MGGAETRIMDLYRHIDREKVQFDFLVHYRRSDAQKADGVGTDTDALYQARPQEDFDEEALSLGARIYVLPRFTGTNLSEYKKACHTLFAQHHEWAVIEGHMTSMASVYLPIAKEEAAKAAGAAEDAVRIPVTIAHARSAGVDAGLRGAATRIFRRSLPRKCDIMMSCSGPASVSVFGEKAARSGKVRIVPNALDLDAFRYDADAREKARAEYGISGDTLVIGHVGRFDPVKNQAFLAKVGAELKKICRHKFLFLFVGAGDLQASVREAFEGEGLGDKDWDDKADALSPIPDIAAGAASRDPIGETCLPPIADAKGLDFSSGCVPHTRQHAVYVRFTGLLPREKTAEVYQAFDVFALPSLYEGLPGTVIEAQAAGLPCVIADTITEEVAVTGLVQRLPLNDPATWARAIAEAAEIPERQPDAAGRARISADALERLAGAGYEIRSAARKMQEMYLELAVTSVS